MGEGWGKGEGRAGEGRGMGGGKVGEGWEKVGGRAGEGQGKGGGRAGEGRGKGEGRAREGREENKYSIIIIIYSIQGMPECFFKFFFTRSSKPMSSPISLQ